MRYRTGGQHGIVSCNVNVREATHNDKLLPGNDVALEVFIDTISRRSDGVRLSKSIFIEWW